VNWRSFPDSPDDSGLASSKDERDVLELWKQTYLPKSLFIRVWILIFWCRPGESVGILLVYSFSSVTHKVISLEDLVHTQKSWHQKTRCGLVWCPRATSYDFIILPYLPVKFPIDRWVWIEWKPSRVQLSHKYPVPSRFQVNMSVDSIFFIYTTKYLPLMTNNVKLTFCIVWIDFQWRLKAKSVIIGSTRKQNAAEDVWISRIW